MLVLVTSSLSLVSRLSSLSLFRAPFRFFPPFPSFSHSLIFVCFLVSSFRRREKEERERPLEGERKKISFELAATHGERDRIPGDRRREERSQDASKEGKERRSRGSETYARKVLLAPQGKLTLNHPNPNPLCPLCPLCSFRLSLISLINCCIFADFPPANWTNTLSRPSSSSSSSCSLFLKTKLLIKKILADWNCWAPKRWQEYAFQHAYQVHSSCRKLPFLYYRAELGK